MDIKTQLLEDMKQAMRDRDSVKLGVIRFLRSEIKNYEIDNGDQEDKGVQKVIASQAKKMKDASEEFEKAGRTDLVEEEAAKIIVIESYLPEQMSDEELQAIVTKVVSETEDKNMGKLIGAVIKETDGQADGGRVSGMVRAELQK